MSRLRRSAAALLGIHLLQATVLAASPACGPTAAMSDMALTVHGVANEAVDGTAHAHHRAHHGAGLATAAAIAPTADHADTSAPPAMPHGPSSAACPMAMTCTVAAVVASAPVITTQLVAVSGAPDVVAWIAPSSLHRAPEPPPPRG